ncbi:MAG: uroporphyrinogen-III C-methyltransferase, partial [Alcaligenaceae bacterium]|nr:uroporphyrinogen-III C-methyltransferase [Alcaligenaceae bacterium]
MTDQDHSTAATPGPKTPDSKTSEPKTKASAKAAAGSEGAGQPKARPEKKRSSLWLVVVILIVLLAALGAGLWSQHRDMIALQAGLSSQGAHSAQQAQQANDVARQALDLAQRQSQALAAMQADLNTTREQVQGLDQALQMATDSGSDLLLLNDIDHLVTIAQQQLKLSGNVANAIISLETAQAQLSRANRPQMAPLQQAINGDVDRLRAVATIDFPGLSAQLDQLAALVGKAPLLAPDTPQPDTAPGNFGTSTPAAPIQSNPDTLPADAPWWRVAAHDAWQ